MIKQLTEIANRLGYHKGLKSFSKLYQDGGINTFGWPDASMWTLTIELNRDDKVCGVDICTTYFEATPKVVALRGFATYNEPKTFEDVIEFLDKLKIK